MFIAARIITHDALGNGGGLHLTALGFCDELVNGDRCEIIGGIDLGGILAASTVAILTAHVHSRFANQFFRDIIPMKGKENRSFDVQLTISSHTSRRKLRFMNGNKAKKHAGGRPAGDDDRIRMGKVIRQYRLAAGLEQGMLAKQAGCSPNAVST